MSDTLNIIPGRIALKPYTLAELSRLYEVDKRTFKMWIEPYKDQIGKRIGKYYSVLQVRFIFEQLGLPALLNVAEQ